MLNGRQLRRLFQDFNRDYFAGRLPAYAIRVVNHINSLDADGYTYRKQKLIKIRRGMTDENAVNMLLHEMAHAATTDHHGMPWKKEMIRLRDACAPLCPPDSEINLIDWGGTHVSRAHFRAAIQPMLADIPSLTLPQAVREFIRNEGGSPTITGFLRRYPWARGVFNDAKRLSAPRDVFYEAIANARRRRLRETHLNG